MNSQAFSATIFISGETSSSEEPTSSSAENVKSEASGVSGGSTPGTALKMVAKKMIAGQVFWGPVMLPCFFTWNELLAGRGFNVNSNFDKLVFGGY